METLDETTLPEEPQEQEPQEDTSQELVSKRVLGKTVEMPAWMADLWDERERDFQRRFNEPTRREQQLARQQAEAANQQARQTQAPSPGDQDLEWYAKGPTKAMQELRQQILEEQRAERAAQENHAQQLQAWWGRFWAKHEDLVGKEWAVRSVANDFFHDLGALQEEECHNRMAELTRDRLGQTRAGRVLTQRQVQDPRSSPATPRRAPSREEPQKTLISVIEERREARRRAQLGMKDK